jgi:hypothetical protein
MRGGRRARQREPEVVLSDPPERFDTVHGTVSDQPRSRGGVDRLDPYTSRSVLDHTDAIEGARPLAVGNRPSSEDGGVGHPCAPRHFSKVAVAFHPIQLGYDKD